MESFVESYEWPLRPISPTPSSVSRIYCSTTTCGYRALVLSPQCSPQLPHKALRHSDGSSACTNGLIGPFTKQPRVLFISNPPQQTPSQVKPRRLKPHAFCLTTVTALCPAGVVGDPTRHSITFRKGACSANTSKASASPRDTGQRLHCYLVAALAAQLFAAMGNDRFNRGYQFSDCGAAHTKVFYGGAQHLSCCRVTKIPPITTTEVKFYEGCNSQVARVRLAEETGA